MRQVRISEPAVNKRLVGRCRLVVEAAINVSTLLRTDAIQGRHRSFVQAVVTRQDLLIPLFIRSIGGIRFLLEFVNEPSSPSSP